MDALYAQKGRWKDNKARSLGARFKLFYNSVDGKKIRVRVILMK